ncbi:MAG: 30S ribosomal protein S20, partial [Candidatus Marinimicrobia bacterium]|nr:30S ribosomal protein S20 [Candidatus Neomarinimicrobiota bacterium]
KKDAETKLVNTISHIDKVAHKNIIHKNKASRLKGKLQKVVNEMK